MAGVVGGQSYAIRGHGEAAVRRMEVVIAGLIAGGACVPIGAFQTISLAVVAEVVGAEIVAVIAD